MRAADTEYVIGVVNELQAGCRCLARGECLVRETIAEDRRAIDIAVVVDEANELRPERRLRSEEEDAPRSCDGPIGPGVVRHVRLAERDTRRREIDQAVVAGIAPGEDPNALVACRRVDHDADVTVGGDGHVSYETGRRSDGNAGHRQNERVRCEVSLAVTVEVAEAERPVSVSDQVA